VGGSCRNRFDLGSQDESVLIECKSYTFTGGGNEPAAKINHAKTDAQLLKESRATRKITSHLINRQTDLWLEKELKAIQNCC
jgi:hypothetical protein